MNDTAKFALFAVGGLLVAGVAGKHLMGNSAHAEYVEALKVSPYTERDLAAEYGLDLDWQPKRSGAWAGASNSTYALQVNNAIEAEASRIQIEFERKVGTAGAFAAMAGSSSFDALEIARQRFNDQGLWPLPQ